jgi:glycine hydroxymethyltransferase
MTTRGLKEDDFTAVVDLIDTVLTNANNASVIKEVKGKVHDMMQHFPLY